MSGDISAVRAAIAELLPNKAYDDGSLGPVFVRLAWHASGTFDKYSRTGGSDGATIRFAPEATDPANAGLQYARAFLEPLKGRFPWLSYADLYTLAGVVAVEEMGGPKIPWRGGRSDKPDGKTAPPNGRLPDAAKDQTHVRDVFYRMGFDDKDIVALMGAHALGRCHTDRSGYDGPWTRSPTRFSNMYFIQLSKNEWVPRVWSGPAQFADKATGELMMLPSDMAMIKDSKFRAHVDKYAADKQAFFADFADAFGRLLDLGVKRAGTHL